jgi:hypothetical protein
LILLGLVVAAGAATLTVGGGASGAGKARLVPDLVQVAPAHVDLIERPKKTLLTFAAAAENHGRGPLIINASRPNRSKNKMTARQYVARADGSRERVGWAGKMRYVRSPDHSHWHLRDFMRFELRTEDGQPLGRDQKTGFCLGDRYDSTARTPGEPDRPHWVHRCGRGEPRLLRMNEGISVGYGDVYVKGLEGQYIDITGVPPGRYVLVHHVNPYGRLLDLRSDNDVASVALVLGEERARVVRRCNGTARCVAP